MNTLKRWRNNITQWWEQDWYRERVLDATYLGNTVDIFDPDTKSYSTYRDMDSISWYGIAYMRPVRNFRLDTEKKRTNFARRAFQAYARPVTIYSDLRMCHPKAWLYALKRTLGTVRGRLRPI